MLLQFQDYPAYLQEIVFKDDATAYELLTIALTFSVLWAFVFAAARPLLRSISYGRPWLRAACEREYEHGGKDVYDAMKMTKEEAIEMMMKDWVTMQVINIQHFTGAILCIPSLLGLGDPSWASSLAACGVLSEIGWEIEDVAEAIYLRFFTEQGLPFIVIAIRTFHHSLTSILGLPMVLYYRGLKLLHWLCFDLQIVALVSVLVEYSKILDISKPNELRQFKVVNFLVLVLVVWTRFLHWIYLCVQIELTWYHDKTWSFIAVGAVSLTAFSYFNAMLIVIPLYKRFKKFLNVSAKYESLPPDAPEAKRRQSTMKLEKSVRKLLLEETIDIEGRIILFLKSFDLRGKVDRRQTMPPRRRMTWGSTRLI